VIEPGSSTDFFLLMMAEHAGLTREERREASKASALLFKGWNDAGVDLTAEAVGVATKLREILESGSRTYGPSVPVLRLSCSLLPGGAPDMDIVANRNLKKLELINLLIAASDALVQHQPVRPAGMQLQAAEWEQYQEYLKSVGDVPADDRAVILHSPQDSVEGEGFSDSSSGDAVLEGSSTTGVGETSVLFLYRMIFY
jgi:hypothetical protein